MLGLKLHVVFAICVAIFQISAVLSQDSQGYAGQVTGGGNTKAVYVSNEQQLRDAVQGDKPKVVKITANIWLGTDVRVGANTSILGANSKAGISNKGLQLVGTKNVLIQGLKFTNFICTQITPTYICHQGVSIKTSTNVWVDHNEFSADLNHAHDYYTMGIGVQDGADYITVSYNKFHDIYHTLLVGSADNTDATDKGKFHITFHHNWFYNCMERTPMIRFGTAHLYNNLLENIKEAGMAGYIDAKLFIEANVFVNVNKAVTTHHDWIKKVDGVADVRADNSFTNSPTAVTRKGTFSAPYKYSKDNVAAVAAKVKGQAGPTKLSP